LAQVLGLTLAPPQANSPPIRCQELLATADGSTGLTLSPGIYSLENLGASPAEFLLGRFSGELAVSLGAIEPGVLTALTIPRDRSQRPWILGLKGSAKMELCIRQ
jgi:hypothetical protein